MFARACALALLASGCFVDDGLPDGPTAATTAPATSTSPTTSTTTQTTTTATTATTTGTTTTGEPDTTTTTDATSTTSTTSTTAPLTTTMQPGCGKAGETCGDDTCCGCLTCQAGQCVPYDAACGTCQACDTDGACAPVAPGTACTAASDMCTGTVFGAVGKACYAYGPATGQCDAGGNCDALQCEGMGAAIVTCDSALCANSDACLQGTAVDGVSGFCVESGQTSGCDVDCDNTIDGGVLQKRQCGPGGACTVVEEYACGAYKCDGQTACKAACDSEIDCAATANCVGGSCVYN
jgi:hypothetical protein